MKKSTLLIIFLLLSIMVVAVTVSEEGMSFLQHLIAAGLITLESKETSNDQIGEDAATRMVNYARSEIKPPPLHLSDQQHVLADSAQTNSS